MMRVTVAAILLLFSLGCGGAPEVAPNAPGSAGPAAGTPPAAASQPAASQPAAPTTQSANILPNDGTRKIGDVTRCPLSDEVFTVEKDSFSANHEGKTYYVCCRGCVRKFLGNPTQFLSSNTP